MRTTIAISDEILRAAKVRARERGETLGQFVDAALQRELAQSPDAGVGPAIPVFTRGTGPKPGVDLNSNRALAEILDEGVALEARR